MWEPPNDSVSLPCLSFPMSCKRRPFCRTTGPIYTVAFQDRAQQTPSFAHFPQDFFIFVTLSSILTIRLQHHISPHSFVDLWSLRSLWSSSFRKSRLFLLPDALAIAILALISLVSGQDAFQLLQVIYVFLLFLIFHWYISDQSHFDLPILIDIPYLLPTSTSNFLMWLLFLFLSSFLS